MLASIAFILVLVYCVALGVCMAAGNADRAMGWE
jgi:hypothetical protein